MRELKYIIIGIPNMEPRAILFNGMFNHSDIWLGARKSLPCSLVSAGFCSVDLFGRVEVWGGSESLKNVLKKEVNSHPHDAVIITKTLRRTFIL